jgi:hypothetical protein
MAARHCTRLNTIRWNLLEMAEQWEDVDDFCRGALLDLADQAKGLVAELLPEDDDKHLMGGRP